ncbi:hypothetical protein [Halosimplex carlsbadense]|uniref:hypothetical protein n=1 Tax=Halosimplex carlsbadense TaxID=171164 RepID=UPI001268A2C9|nr:hypothetical protein [Halosimplex carlsbadense]
MAITVVVSGCPTNLPSGGYVTFNGEMNATAQGFTLNGTIENQGQGDVPTFRNVTVYLYTTNGSLVASKSVGELSRRTGVSMDTTAIPEFVVFDSPDFWDTESIQVDYYEYVNESERDYTIRSVGSREQLPPDSDHN